MFPKEATVSTSFPHDSNFLLFPSPTKNPNLHLQKCVRRPLFFVEGKDVWKGGPVSAFTRPGSPSLVLVCRLIAREASQVLHEIRELRFMVLPQGLARGAISCYHQLYAVEAFVLVLQRTERLGLTINAHACPSHEASQLALLNFVCTVLDERPAPPHNLAMSFQCCFGSSKTFCKDKIFNPVERFQSLEFTSAAHHPWNSKCTWAKVVLNSTKTPSGTVRQPMTERKAFEYYFEAIKRTQHPSIEMPRLRRWNPLRFVCSLAAGRPRGRFKEDTGEP